MTSLTNTRKVGYVQIRKTTDQGSATFTFDVTCGGVLVGDDVAVSGSVAGGTSSVFGPFPTGTSCTIVENPDNPDNYVEGANQTFSVTESTSVAPIVRTFSNTRRVGYVQIRKTTDQGSATFTFDVTCGGVLVGDDVAVSGSVAGGTSSVFGPFPTGTSCTIVENPDNPDNYVEGANQTFSVTESTSVAPIVRTFSNTRRVGYVQIRKTTDQGSATFTFDVTCGGVLVGDDVAVSGSVAGGTSSVFGPFPTGTSCTIVENPDNPDNYVEGANQTFSVTESTSVAPIVRTFSNMRRLGSLTIRKIVSPVSADSFSFSYSCSNGATGAFTGTGAAVPGNVVQTVSALPTGTTCTASETLQPLTYASSVVPVGSINATTIASGSVTIDENGETITFTNTRRVGTVTITKTVDIAPTGSSASFSFLLNCPGTANDETFTIVIAVAATSGTATSLNVPTQTTCSVTETAADARYDLDPSTESVTFVEGSANAVSFHNIRKTGTLIVKKIVNPVSADSFSFSYRCGTADAVAFNGTGTATPGNVVQTVTGIPTGTICKASETLKSNYVSEVTPAGSSTATDIVSGEVTIGTGDNASRLRTTS